VSEEELERSLRREALRQIEEARRFLDKEEKAILLLHPLNVLRRGYTLTFSRGKVVKSIKDCSVGQELVTQTFDGQIVSEVKGTHGRIDGTLL
jgi:exodeoxyribonuclease VII large subunit